MNFTLIMTQVNPEIHRQLEMSGLRHSELEQFLVFQDLDHGLEYCEGLLLHNSPVEGNGGRAGLANQLKDIWPKGVAPDGLLPYLEQQYVPKGAHLIRQSENSECLYFIESGLVSAQLELDSGRSMRLRTQGPGTVVGEVGLFLGGRRTASVTSPSNHQLFTTFPWPRSTNAKGRPDVGAGLSSVHRLSSR
jgi:SulP family sulfate permease